MHQCILRIITESVTLNKPVQGVERIITVTNAPENCKENPSTGLCVMLFLWLPHMTEKYNLINSGYIIYTFIIIYFYYYILKIITSMPVGLHNYFIFECVIYFFITMYLKRKILLTD